MKCQVVVVFKRSTHNICSFQVAKESALSFVPDADITAIHGSVTTSEYGVGFYKQVVIGKYTSCNITLNAWSHKAPYLVINAGIYQYVLKKK